MHVAVNYSNNREQAEELVQRLSVAFGKREAGSPRFAAVQADMSSRSEIMRLVETVACMGRLDAVISNAGWTRFTGFANLDKGVEEAGWDRCFNMNVKGHLFLMHGSRKHLNAAAGVFVTTASLAGVTPAGVHWQVLTTPFFYGIEGPRGPLTWTVTE